MANSNTNTITNPVETLAGKLSKKSGQHMWVGILIAVLGVLAIVFPQVSTMGVTLVIGWILFFAGVVFFFNSFSYEGTGPFFGALLMSLLMIGLGLFFVFSPMEGALVMTLALGILFIIQAAFMMVLAFEIRNVVDGWAWLLIGAIIVLILAYLILSNLLDASTVTLGYLLGINLIVTGVVMAMVAMKAKKAVKPYTAAGRASAASSSSSSSSTGSTTS